MGITVLKPEPEDETGIHAGEGEDVTDDVKTSVACGSELKVDDVREENSEAKDVETNSEDNNMSKEDQDSE